VADSRETSCVDVLFRTRRIISRRRFVLTNNYSYRSNRRARACVARDIMTARRNEKKETRRPSCRRRRRNGSFQIPVENAYNKFSSMAVRNRQIRPTATAVRNGITAVPITVRYRQEMWTFYVGVSVGLCGESARVRSSRIGRYWIYDNSHGLFL